MILYLLDYYYMKKRLAFESRVTLIRPDTTELGRRGETGSLKIKQKIYEGIGNILNDWQPFVYEDGKRQ